MNRPLQRVPDGMTSTPSPVVVFWRPGCPYCTRLRSRLHRAGVAIEEINIWEDPTAASLVRSVNGGNETVPTVGLWDDVLVNPPARAVIEEIRRRDPVLIGAARGGRGRGQRLVALQWAVIVVLIASTVLADGLGHSSLSWLIDAAAAAWYLGMRTLRHRVESQGPDVHKGPASGPSLGVRRYQPKERDDMAEPPGS
jgi:mycoredoxin